jgi:hypothetical protein
MRPSLYRSGVVFPDLESCFPQNKGLRDKIGLDLNLPEIFRARWSHRAPYFLVSYNNPKDIQMTEQITKTQ